MLWGRSAYSLLRGTRLPAALVGQAAQFGYRACGLFDRENLYGALPFLEAADQAGIRPLLGAELLLPGRVLAEAAGARCRGGLPDGMADGRAVPAAVRLLLVCRDLNGYRRLARTLTRFHLAGPRAAAAELLRATGGLSVLADQPEALGWLREGVAAADLGALLVRPGPGPGAEARLLSVARRLDVAPVAACRAFVLSAHERGTARLLVAIRDHELWGGREEARHQARGGNSGMRGRGDRLLPVGAAAARFHDLPEALAGAGELRARCQLQLAALASGQVLLPRLDLADGARRLRARCRAGLRERPGSDSPMARRRLENELRVIEALGFVDYFLIVGELVDWARRQAIAVMGRGSGAASLVAYVLGVTGVDPIRYRLCFERFLHPLRRDPPDLDLDVAWNRRAEVLEYALGHFGEERAALIGTHQFFGARGALREAGRARGLSDDQVARGARRLPYAFFGRAQAAAGGSGERGEAEALRSLAREDDPALAGAARAALRLLGLPRNLGTHAAGLVLAPGPLCEFVPLERSAAGHRVTQFEMRAIARIGLVKIDLLGNRALATVAETCRRVGGLALGALPGDDPATGRLLSRGATLGCIQLESPAMRTLLRQLGAADREQVIAAVALIRPGPAGSGMKEAFIRRARGEEPVRVLHASLLTALESTLGLPLYEEDVITMAALVGGSSLAEADLLRRAVAEAVRRAKVAGVGHGDAPEGPGGGERMGGGACSEGMELERLERGFLRAARQRGIAAAAARGVWDALVRFAAYAFCKAHAAGYGVLAYQMAWLKVHHPGPFFAALLNNHRGMYPARVYVDEARRRGLRLRPPCVVCSGRGWHWEPDPGEVGTLRAGLGLVRGLRTATAAALIAERAEHPFGDLSDLARRVPASLVELDALVLSGACDEAFGQARGEMLWQLRRRARRRSPRPAHALRAGAEGPSRQGTLALQSECRAAHARSGWKRVAVRQRARLERRFLGVSLACHPTQLLTVDPGAGVEKIADLHPGIGGRVSVQGIVSALRRLRDAGGRVLLLITLEDRSGMIECMVGEPLAAEVELRVDQLIAAGGRLRQRYGAVTLQLDEVRGLGEH